MEQRYLPSTPQQRLQDLMKEHKITQAVLAKKIGVTESTLSRFINGTKDTLSLDQMISIARIFNVSTDFLLCMTDVPDRKNYDISELGLSAEAARNLYTGRTNPQVVSRLLENRRFAQLTNMIALYFDDIVDILDNLRTLSALNPPVSVEFETEGITYTGDGRNNLLISLLAALAEMESQQKSEAIKAGIRWRMAEGIYKFSVQNTLGFYRDHFGRLVIEPTEARIVEYIYESCLEGATPAEIAAALTEQGIKSPMGNDLWSAGTVRSILRNEKYCGDALMQKTYTKDFRTHKSVKNTDLNMYFKENHHTAIVKKEDWIKVQKLLSERHSTAKRATLRRLSNHFVAYRVKDGLFKGYLIMDSRWSFMERQEFMKIVDEAQNTMK